MPQLDKVTFLPQFFWLCVFFASFYIFQVKGFLPKMSRILKLRKKRSFSLNSSPNQKSESFAPSGEQKESDLVETSSETVLKHGFEYSKSSLQFSAAVPEVQKHNSFSDLNRYFKNLTDNHLSNSLASSGKLISSNFSSRNLNTKKENSLKPAFLSRLLKIENIKNKQNSKNKQSIKKSKKIKG